MLTFENLKKLSELTENDVILVYTHEGVKSINAQLLGAAVSPTNLYERFAKSISTIFNAEKISTSNKIQRYLAGDTSSETYMEIDGTSVIWYNSEVSFKDSIPQVEQYMDMSGKKVFWSGNPETAEYSDDGYPWKEESGKKMYLTYEETPYPVMCYKYSTKTLKKSLLSESGLTEEYLYGSRQTGFIKKTDDDFIFSVSIDGQECGIKITVDKNTGDVSGELLGVWEGLNDIDPSQRLTKDSIKEFMYENQDLNSYNSTILLDTSNKIGWYLMGDTSNKVFSYIKDNEIIMRRARVTTNITNGNPISSQAKNIYGNLLYWTEDMSNGGSISAYGYPMKSGTPVFLTTNETNYPAYVYEYQYDDLLKMSYNPQNGIEQEFKDASGNIGKVFLSQSGLVSKFISNSDNKETSIIMNSAGGILAGKWKVSSDGSTFVDITSKETKNYTILLPNESGEVDFQLEDNKTFVVQQYSLEEIKIDVSIPDVEDSRVIRSTIFVPSTDVSIVWGDNIVGTETSKIVNEAGGTEFTLTHYKGLNNLIYISKL